MCPLSDKKGSKNLQDTTEIFIFAAKKRKMSETITKENVLQGIRTALKHKREALLRTQEQWEKEGIKGTVVSL